MFDKIRRVLGFGERKDVEFSPELMDAIRRGWGFVTKSGVQISARTAFGLTAFHRGVMSIAEGVAMLPVELYVEDPVTKSAKPDRTHPLYDLIRHKPSDLQDSFQFHRMMLAHAVASGNGVVWKNKVRGRLAELLPVIPEGLGITVDNFLRRQYRFSLESGITKDCYADEVLHLQGPSWELREALNPTSLGREALGLSQALQDSHANLHRNGVRPSGALKNTSSQKLRLEDVSRIRTLWEETYTGIDNTGKPLILDQFDWVPLRQTGVDAEHLDTRKHQIEEIARLLGVFPIMLFHAGDQSPTFASAEAFFAAHLQYTLTPWIVAVTRMYETQLLSAEERRAGYHFRVDTSEFIRASLQDRAAYYSRALGTGSSPGWLTQNEIRADDGWDPLPDESSDKVWNPLTMTQGGGQPAQDTPEAETKKATPAFSGQVAPLYLSRPLVTAPALYQWAERAGVRDLIAPEDMHVTVVYSRTPVDWFALPSKDSAGELTCVGGPRVVTKLGKAVALVFQCPDLSERHQSWVDAGASSDFGPLVCHVSLSYTEQDVPEGVVPFMGDLVFGPEKFMVAKVTE